MITELAEEFIGEYYLNIINISPTCYDIIFDLIIALLEYNKDEIHDIYTTAMIWLTNQINIFLLEETINDHEKILEMFLIIKTIMIEIKDWYENDERYENCVNMKKHISYFQKYIKAYE